MTKELHYFNVNGLAEPIRYILHYTKQKFEDIRHDFVTWPGKKDAIKDTLPYGQFPLYKEDGRTLWQSLAITKYVARDSDLIPKNPWKQAVLESVVYTIYDYWKNVVAYILEEDLGKRYEMKKKLIDETIHYFFSRFEKHLEENGGFFTGKLSWAEFVLCTIIESTELVLEIELTGRYPMVTAVVEMIRNLPGVKEHIAARGPYKLPYTTVKYKDLHILDRRA